MTKNKQLTVGVLNISLSLGVEHIILKEGHILKRLSPNWNPSVEEDYLCGYSSQLTYATSELDLIGCDFVIVDEEAPGAFHKLQEFGVPLIGTNIFGSNLELDREFAKRYVTKFGVKAPKSWVVSTEEDALNVVKECGGLVVLKAGEHFTANQNFRTIVCEVPSDAETIISKMNYFENGGRLRIEERIMEGAEVAFGAWFNGDKFVLPYYVAFEHKTSCHSGRGIITGEVGTILFHEYEETSKVMRLFSAFEPALRRTGFVGMFDINTIIQEDGSVWFLEFTPRLGCPTLEEIVSVYDDGFCNTVLRMLQGKPLRISTNWICSVCAFTYGAPLPVDPLGGEEYPLFEITGIEEASKTACVVPVAAKTDKDNKLFIEFDRALVVNGLGNTLPLARARAYEAIKKIKFWSMTYREDIGRDHHTKMLILEKAGFVSNKRVEECACK